jgi:isopenicillin-N epimerase
VTSDEPGATASHAGLWQLDPRSAHLNHGSYGAVPRPVMAERLRILKRIENSPERFHRDTANEELAQVRAATGRFLQLDDRPLALVENVTSAVSVVLRSLRLRAGASIVLTNQAYPSVKFAVEHLASKYRLRVRIVELPLESQSPEDFSASVLAAVDSDTQLLVLDQVTSSTALRLPVEMVIEKLGRQVPVLVDGAHAPGMLENPVTSGADFWVGNLHKWAFAPKSVGALVVAPEFQDRLEPPAMAVGGDAESFSDRFDYQGTRDLSAFLALPRAFEFPKIDLDLSWEQLRAKNMQILASGCGLLAEGLNIKIQIDPQVSMCTLSVGLKGDSTQANLVMQELRTRGTEIAVFSFDGEIHIRVSAQVYVRPHDFLRLLSELHHLRVSAR